jgi:hypothetical protein
MINIVKTKAEEKRMEGVENYFHKYNKLSRACVGSLWICSMYFVAYYIGIAVLIFPFLIGLFLIESRLSSSSPSPLKFKTKNIECTFEDFLSIARASGLRLEGNIGDVYKFRPAGFIPVQNASVEVLRAANELIVVASEEDLNCLEQNLKKQFKSC